MFLIKKFLFKIIYSLLFFSSFAHAKVSYVDHAVAQFAGEIGLIAVGLGKTITPNYYFNILYGVVPPEISKGPLIETIAFKQNYRFYQWDRTSFYGGLSVYHVLGLNYQTSNYGLPPKGYYPIGSIRGQIYVGSSLLIDSSKNLYIYFESGINDVWITNYVNNIGVLDPIPYFSMALGLMKSF